MKIAPFSALLVGAALATAPLNGEAAEAPAAGPIRVDGGVLDPAFPDAEVFIGVPTAAKAPPSCKTSETYLALIKARQFDKIADLYTDDAVVRPPLKGGLAVGRQQIDDFYRNVVAKVQPDIIAVAYAGGPGECFQVHAVRKSMGGEQRYVLTTAALFSMDSAGKFTRMVAFPRPGAGNLAGHQSK